MQQGAFIKTSYNFVSFFLSLFRTLIFLRFRSFSVLYFLFRKKTRSFLFCLVFYLEFLFHLLVITCWLSSLFSMLYIGYSFFFRPLISCQEKRLGCFSFFCCDFLFHLLVVTCWLSSSFSMLYIGCGLFFFFRLFAGFPCSFSLLFSLLVFFALSFFVLFTCNVFVDTV